MEAFHFLETDIILHWLDLIQKQAVMFPFCKSLKHLSLKEALFHFTQERLAAESMSIVSLAVTFCIIQQRNAFEVRNVRADERMV